MLYIISIVPILLYLLLVKSLDGFSIATVKKMAIVMLWGAAVCVALFFDRVAASWESIWVNALIEEVLKALPILVLLATRHIAFFTQTIVYGAAVGAGFALAENFLYVYTVGDAFTLGDSIVRGFGTSMLHIGCTALVASIGLVLCHLVQKQNKAAAVPLLPLALVPSVCIHWLYNLFLLPELYQLLIVVAVMFILFLVINTIDGKLIHRWLDMCISNDIGLLAAIHSGNLQSTEAGKYLLQIKKNFHPEVFFDICVYLGLFLELSIAAKSRMIMREAGIEMPADPKEHELNMAKIAEWHSLQKAIGKAGLMTLSPIIDQKTADHWVINELL